MRATRAALLEDRDLTGTAWCRRYAGEADAWLGRVFARATGGDDKGVALLAVGGYGWGELAPASDLDLLLVHDRKGRIKPVADAIWYPVWDTGLHLDHSVRTAKEVRAAMDADIKVALGLLDARRVAGDANLAEAVLRRVLEQWTTRAGRWLPTVDDVTRARHDRFGDLAFLLEPDLKESRGGQRDLRLLRSLGRVVPVLAGVLDDPALSRSADTIVAARVELQRTTGRSTNLLLLQDQDAVAEALRYADADALMAALADAGRTLAWVNDDGWRRLESWLAGPPRRAGGRDHPLEGGLVLRDGEVTLVADAPTATDPSLALRAAAASAELDKPLARSTLDRLAAEAAVPAGIWPPGDPARPVAIARRRPTGGRRHRIARPGRALGAVPAGVGADPQQAAAQRLPPLHRGPASARDRRPGRHPRPAPWPARICCCSAPSSMTSARAAAADHTEVGIVVVRELAARLGLPRRRCRHPGDDGPLPPAAAGGGHPAGPRRPGDGRRGGRRRRATGTPSTCWPP